VWHWTWWGPCPWSSPLSILSLLPKSHSHRIDLRPDDYDDGEVGDESLQATRSELRRPIHPPASDPIRRHGEALSFSRNPSPSPYFGAILTSWWMCLLGLRRVPAAALPDPGGQRPPLPHRPHHRTVPSSLLLLSLSPTPWVSVRSIQTIGRGGGWGFYQFSGPCGSWSVFVY
jgi:hypothetical protein